VRELVGGLMVLGGLGLIGLGVYYFVNGWRAAGGVLLFATAFGTLLVGVGMLIPSGATRARLIVASVALGLSSVLMLGLCALLGPQPVMFIVFLLTNFGFSVTLARVRQMGAGHGPEGP
jgi:hypothetical protein